MADNCISKFPSFAKDAMKTSAQFVLKVFRWLGIDLYRMYVILLQKRMWRLASSNGNELSPNGVCLAFPAYHLTSLSQVGRDFAEVLHRTHIPFEVFDTEIIPTGAACITKTEIDSFRNYITGRITQRTVLTFIMPPIVKSQRYANAIFQFWEFESGLLEKFPSLFEGVKLVLAPSDFCLNYLRRIAPPNLKVAKLRYPFPLPDQRKRDRMVARNAHEIPCDCFVVVCSFSLGAWYERKNPDGILEAFAKAFPKTAGTRLVIKATGAYRHSDNAMRLKAKISALGLSAAVMIIGEDIKHEEIYDLFAAADVYISLHRGEGLGLGMLEAMAVGTPVICTGYGGNTDFCNNDTAFIVDYTMSPAAVETGFYRYVKEWAEPDIDQAASYLREIFEHPELGTQKAKNATSFIDEYYSVDNFEKEMKEALGSINAHGNTH